MEITSTVLLEEVLMEEREKALYKYLLETKIAKIDPFSHY